MVRHIVVIEDESAVLGVACQALRDEGYVATGMEYLNMEALAALEAPSAFLVDLRLPGMHGIDVARWLQDHGFNDVPIIAMSASSEEISEALQSGMFHGILAKPFDLHELLDRALFAVHTEA